MVPAKCAVVLTTCEEVAAPVQGHMHVFAQCMEALSGCTQN
jgi:hypothetical protein